MCARAERAHLRFEPSVSRPSRWELLRQEPAGQAPGRNETADREFRDREIPDRLSGPTDAVLVKLFAIPLPTVGIPQRGKFRQPLDHSFDAAGSGDVLQMFANLLVNGAASRSERRSEEHTSELQSLRHLVCR